MMKVRACLLVIGISLGGFPASAGDLAVYVTDAKGNPVKDAVIEVISPKVPIPADWDYSGLIDQQDKEFVDNAGGWKRCHLPKQ